MTATVTAIIISITTIINIISLVTGTEYVQNFTIYENIPIGSKVGNIAANISNTEFQPPFTVIPINGELNDFDIDATSGEIKTKLELDRETCDSYSFVIFPSRGSSIHVTVTILDINDNSPVFPVDFVAIELPENSAKIVRSLQPAYDGDLGVNSVQRYSIVKGNDQNLFNVISNVKADGVSYLDLSINQQLDREKINTYSLLIQAEDGGDPSLSGYLKLNITISDVNDNHPVFNQSRYYGHIIENATVGTIVLQVFATDLDSGDNGRVEYLINRRQSDRNQYFRVDQSNGSIILNKPLDFESKNAYELIVIGRDCGKQPLESVTFVTIKVIDVNDNKPVINVIFLNDEQSPKIAESAEIGEFVARISVNDPDDMKKSANFNVSLMGGDGAFDLKAHDSFIYLVIVAKGLDRETRANYSLKIVVTDSGSPPLQTYKDLVLVVTDINDNAPQFSQNVYYATVSEAETSDVFVTQVFAKDLDEGFNSLVSYRLNNNNSQFKINSKTGIISTRTRLDCELNPNPILTVTATDNGVPPLTATATVSISILDRNDNEPVFEKPVYSITVEENLARGQCILKVFANDLDCGKNAIVNYTIEEDNEQVLQQQTQQLQVYDFQINVTNGEICISQQLDYETRNRYEFPVVATDQGGLRTSTLVQIQVTNVNDNLPVFQPDTYRVTLRKDMHYGKNTRIATVIASDADTPHNLTYRILNHNNQGHLIRINHSSGDLLLVKTHFYEYQYAIITLNISVSDNFGLNAENHAKVDLIFIEFDDYQPAFDQFVYNFAIKEDIDVMSIIGSVSATVSNRNFNRDLQYSIWSEIDHNVFEIDSNTGTIRLIAKLDYEIQKFYVFTIQVSNNHGSVQKYAYSQVHIEVIDVNDNEPRFLRNPIHLNIPENWSLKAPFYTVKCFDPDFEKNSVVNYALINDYDHLFTIHKFSGEIHLRKHLDYENVQSYHLIIQAKDNGVPALSSNLSLLLKVQDVNDNAPKFVKNEYFMDVYESLKIHSLIIQVQASDKDSGNNGKIYYKLSKNSASHKFEIDLKTGWLKLKSNLDREQVSHYDIEIIAYDNGLRKLSASTKIRLNILDVNDNDPKFSNSFYQFQISESDGSFYADRLVGSVKASDADIGSNSMIKYFIITKNCSFTINSNTGEIFVKDPLDREQKEFHDILIEVQDQGIPKRSSRVLVRINITDVNDNVPVIIDPQDDLISVREEQPVGTKIVKIRAIDADLGENSTIIYSLVETKDSDGFEAFEIDKFTGEIRTKIVLNHESKPIYRLGVAAQDNGPLPKRSIRLLRVEVLDLDDNRPTFSSMSINFEVAENVPVTYVVGKVLSVDSLYRNNLIDADNIDKQITFSLVSLVDNQLIDNFDVDRVSGDLIVIKKLDFEKTSKYHFEIRTTDLSIVNNPKSNSIAVDIKILDINDNRPIFETNPILVYVPENIKIGTIVYNFTANDLDEKENGQIRYYLRSFDTKLFSLDEFTGSLELIDYLDYENCSEMIVVVEACDQAVNKSERLTSTVVARILLIDSNDNMPEFVYPKSNTIALLGTHMNIGSTLVHILAKDRDSANNGRVTYSIISGNEDRKLSLNYETGALVVVKPLWNNDEDKRRQTFYTLNISATDHGIPSRQNYFLLNVTLDETEGKQTRLYRSYYHVRVYENTTIGSMLLKIEHKRVFYDEKLRFFVVQGTANDSFEIDSKSGVVRLSKQLNRQIQDYYSVPVFLMDETSGDFDVATIMISVLDVNDFRPKFSRDSCQAISVQENNPFSLVHTLVAYDVDEDDNALVTYDIVDGNSENKFELNDQTGELFVSELDRESQSSYELTIIARDHGYPSLTSTCTLTVYVEDMNDNQPVFEQEEYEITIDENIEFDSSILSVRAVDRDSGRNGKIVYSLENEGQFQFRIDNKTGVIFTNGKFDREFQNIYEFYAIARDKAKCESKSSKVPIRIAVNDLNDNLPTFVHNFYKVQVSPNAQLGHVLLSVQATDADDGINSDIHYRIKDGSSDSFRINHNTGAIAVARNLQSEKDSIVYLTVVASDSNNTYPLSSQCLIEIMIGDISNSNKPKLEFRNNNQTINLKEDALVNTILGQVTAVRSDGRRQDIEYKIILGNEDDKFLIDSKGGEIRVKKSMFDFEIRRNYELVIEAQTIRSPTLLGYYSVFVLISDVNDNSPRFSQGEYRAEVVEGKRKGVFVAEVSAMDLDRDENADILYHIVDGNHENAFIIESSKSGILRTNVVLDREIRDQYKLTIIATDSGIPQMTGTTTLVVDVLDFNDNAPTFPPQKRIDVHEGSEIGNILATVTANDVDVISQLNYKFDANNDNDIFEYFTINSFNGNIMLKKWLDFETRQEFAVKIVASDSIHEVSTTLNIKVINDNDNQPVFQQAYYLTTISELELDPKTVILKVNATDLDNSEITYKLLPQTAGFEMNQTTGQIYFNYHKLAKHDNHFLFTINAYDSLTTKTAVPLVVRLHLDANNKAQLFVKDYKLQIPENTYPGTTLLKFFPQSATNLQPHKYRIEFLVGNDNNTFEISKSNELVLLKEFDREIRDNYQLSLNFISVKDQHETNVVVSIEVDDINDNSPVFDKMHSNIVVNEDISVGSVLVDVKASDLDLKNSPNSQLNFSILSGDDNHFFRMDSLNGNLIVRKRLDFDDCVYGKHFQLVIQCCDQGVGERLCSVETLNVTLKDVNDNKPRFPKDVYYEFVAENEPIGTGIRVVQANDDDFGVYGVLNYSISGISNGDDSWKLFRIDSRTGLISTNVVFDYEYQSKYGFIVNANDIDGNLASTNVYVFVESRDEFYPQFSQRTYKFYLSGNLHVGSILGQVNARDNDQGIDGRLIYSLSTPSSFFRINAINGAIIVKKRLDYQTLRQKIEKNQEISLIVSVSSGKQGSLTNMSIVEISFDKMNGTSFLTETNGSDWIFGFMIAIFFVLIVMGGFAIYYKWYETQKKHQMISTINGTQPKSVLNTSTTTVSSNNYVDPASFDNLRANSTVGSHFNPPKYDEIPSYGLSINGSEVSERSRSSGRGSAEDGDEIVDEEIRMINEKSQMNITQEYLAKLGVVSSESSETSSSNKTKSKASMNGSLSSIINRDDDSNWTDRMGDWGPQYQPLTHVFTEIARFKVGGGAGAGGGGDTASVRSGTSSVHSKLSKTFAPPLPPVINQNRKAPPRYLSNQGKLSLVPHSPVLYDVANDSDLGSNGIAMVPHFSQSMSPLTSKSPNCSPIMPKITPTRLMKPDSPLTIRESEIRI